MNSYTSLRPVALQARPVLLPLFLLLFATVCPAQLQTDNSEIYVEGWKSGKTIESVLNFDLESSHVKQDALVRPTGADYYKIILTWHPAVKQRAQVEYWVVELRQVLSKINRREKLGDNLLTAEGPGPGGDNFPREDLVGYLYPRDTKKHSFEHLVQPNGGYYPINAKRVIKVQNFFVIIKVNSVKFNAANPSDLESMNVTIAFSNNCKNAR